jgi:hypothetical protein
MSEILAVTRGQVEHQQPLGRNRQNSRKSERQSG